jgi:hypothetical protein
MQMGEKSNWKAARGYIIILAILILLIIITIYLSRLQIQRISRDIPMIGGVSSFLPKLISVLKLISKNFLS